MVGLEIKKIGVIPTSFGDIPVASIGEPDPIDYEPFNVLKGAKVLEPLDDGLTIEKEGKISSFFIGESSDALYLSTKPTRKRVYGVLISDHFKTQEDPFSDLVGSDITQLIMNYFTASDKAKNLPYEVILVGSNGLGYQMTADDGEIMVYKDVKDKILGSKFKSLIARGDKRIGSY